MDAHTDINKKKPVYKKRKLRKVPNKLKLALTYTKYLGSLIALIEEIKPMVNSSVKRSLTCFQKMFKDQQTADESSRSFESADTSSEGE